MSLESLVQQINHFTTNGSMSVPIRTDGVEAASQSWKAGAPLKNSSGKLVIAAEDDVAGIIGFATKDASGTTDTAVSYIPALPSLEFECTLEDGTSGDLALAQSHVWGKYSIAKTAGGLWYADQVDTTNKAILVTALVDPVGTVQGRVRARLMLSVAIYN